MKSGLGGTCTSYITLLTSATFWFRSEAATRISNKNIQALSNKTTILHRTGDKPNSTCWNRRLPGCGGYQLRYLVLPTARSKLSMSDARTFIVSRPAATTQQTLVFFMISWSRSLRPGGRDAWKRSPSEEAVMARLPCIPREVINTRTGTASQSAS